MRDWGTGGLEDRRLGDWGTGGLGDWGTGGWGTGGLGDWGTGEGSVTERGWGKHTGREKSM